MKQITPEAYLRDYPCSVTALACALGELPVDVEDYMERLKEDGYASLETANKYIRANLDIRKRITYKKGERPSLKNLHLKDCAIVCVIGHFLYLEEETYYSFYDNSNDEVVCVWIIKD